MIKFIICDDEEIVRKNVNQAITKVMMPIDIDYKIYNFATYNQDFMKIMEEPISQKIYILDIIVKDQSGLTIAHQIRERDWQAIVILLTAHYHLIYNAVNKRLMMLDYICKDEHYEKQLKSVLKTALNILDKNLSLNIKYQGALCKITQADILYIVKEQNLRKLTIKTVDKTYLINLTLKEVKQRLNHKFKQTHRACIVNLDNVKEVNYRRGIITFKNNEVINLLSKKYKKEVKEEWI